MIPWLASILTAGIAGRPNAVNPHTIFHRTKRHDAEPKLYHAECAHTNP